MGQIRVSGLGKAYKQYPNRWSRLFEWLVPFSPSRHHLHWILREVEFTIEPGEAVGIVGVNGAGKSTLLKMIAGTTQPTCGEIRVAGRVAALLELGMGFTRTSPAGRTSSWPGNCWACRSRKSRR